MASVEDYGFVGCLANALIDYKSLTVVRVDFIVGFDNEVSLA